MKAKIIVLAFIVSCILAPIVSAGNIVSNEEFDDRYEADFPTVWTQLTLNSEITEYLCGYSLDRNTPGDCDGVDSADAPGERWFKFIIPQNSSGNIFNFTITNLDDPHYVDLSISVCKSNLYYSSKFICKQFEDMYSDVVQEISVSPVITSEYWIHIMAWDEEKEGRNEGGDLTQIKVEVAQIASSNSDFIEPREISIGPFLGYLDSVEFEWETICAIGCDEGPEDPYDIFAVRGFKGDIVELRFGSQEGHSNSDYGVQVFILPESEFFDTNYSFTLHELDDSCSASSSSESCTSIVNHHFEQSGFLFIRFYSTQGDDSFGGEEVGEYWISMNYSTASQRDYLADLDGDGMADYHEYVCGSEFRNSSSMAPDMDGDFTCDSLDTDIDGDGYTNDAETFLCDATSNPLDNQSTPDDLDGDFLCDSQDTDDDDDGYTDSHEIICDSEPLNSASKPEDFDEDFVPDCIDPDLDNDGVYNSEDAFDYDRNAWKDTDGDGLADDFSSLYSLSAQDLFDDGGHLITVSNSEGTVLCEIGAYSTEWYDYWGGEDNCYFFVESESTIMYDSGEEYYTELLVFLTRPDGLKENISPTAPYGPEELIRLTPSVIPPQSSSPAGTELDYDDDNDGYLDHIELECGSNPLDALSKPVDYDGDLTPDCVDSDNDNEVADQDKEACFVVECKFDQHFTFWGKPVSETKTNSGDDPSLIFLILTLLSIVTVLKIYAKSQSMCWKWEDANSHNRVNANRMEKEFKDFDFGGKNFNISNFYAWWAMLVVLLLGVFVFRELTIIWMVGGAGVASHLYLKIPEHLAAKKWVQLKSTSGGNALPPQPVAPPLSKPTQGRVTNPMPPQPVAPPLSKPTQDGLTLLVKSILNQRPRRWMPIQTQPYSPIVSKPWDAHKAPETELYEPTTPKSTQQKPPKNIDQNDFKLFYDTKLSKLYRSESQKLIKKEPLNKIGKLTLSNEVKILRKLSKAGLGYQVVEGSNQGSKNPLLIMPDLGSQSLLDVVEHLNSSERKNIIHDFTNAIQEIHAQDVVHRDLKLANIMIKEENGEKKFSSLIDFGTAMRSGTAQTEHLLGGTRPYMHPSQHDQNVKSHEGQDWYAFARILVVLTGACHPGGLESYLMDGIETKVDHELRRIGYRDYEVQSIQEFVNLATKPSADDAKSLNLLANEGLKISKIV